ncbi:hypothetical protein M9H77_35804 [Catharanthus roseus]|uniref:Uncharacterized protein n=1 Tax=Catharanthus roseus TaxID=4058 RepID=A0ACB9ZRS5_CATRO|nr:hypothetical protein M9H77_35804 [Catharanthus roseus]
MIESQRHSYHLVDLSPWPISGSLETLATTVGGVMYMYSFQGGATLLSLGLIFILHTMFVWWRDVLCESTLEGHHTKVVQLGLRYGFILFIISEVMLFFALFWAYSHSSLAPMVEIGVAIVSLALVFTGFQGMEYHQAPSTISDSICGSTFFLATSFHGFHVIIGTLFLIICGIRRYLCHLTKDHHVGFEAAAWYWHFVDVVWLFPFVSIYWRYMKERISGLRNERDSTIIPESLSVSFGIARVLFMLPSIPSKKELSSSYSTLLLFRVKSASCNF